MDVLYNVFAQLSINGPCTGLMQPRLYTIDLYQNVLAESGIAFFGKRIQYIGNEEQGNSSESIWALSSNSRLGRIENVRRKDYVYHIVTTDGLEIAEGPRWAQGVVNLATAGQA